MRRADISDKYEDVSRAESYAGLLMMLASFVVAANVCSAIASLAVLS
jgi:hypothetical protein